MEKQRILLVHGWTGRNDKDWFPWAENVLTEKGYEVLVPLMPDTDRPIINPWLKKLDEVLRELRESDILIGHSLGSNAILRFLETKPIGTKVDKVILVAGAQILSNEALPLPEDEEIFKPWRDTPINFQKIKKMANSFIAVFSSNDPWVLLEENEPIYKNKLGAKVIIEKNKGHFTQEDGVTELPNLLTVILA